MTVIVANLASAAYAFGGAECFVLSSHMDWASCLIHSPIAFVRMQMTAAHKSQFQHNAYVGTGIHKTRHRIP